MSQKIHPTAVIDKGAKLGKGVVIEPYVVINANVTIEDNVTIKSHAYIDGNTTIGEGTVIWPSACIGTRTQDKKFKGETTYVKIGKHCEIREFVTINSSCHEGSVVEIGDHTLIMACCHVAHNCTVGKGVIMANGALLAGHVEVEDFAVIGGMTPVHQYVRIGRNAMVGGFSRVTHDVPPYLIGASVPFKVGGLNIVGLKRHGFEYPVRRELARAYKFLYRSGLIVEEALDKIERHVEPIDEVLHFLDFCRSTKRGIIGIPGTLNGDLGQEETDEELEELMEEAQAELIKVKTPAREKRKMIESGI
jgi:UDP-N-acetylglucosamine acyltransferase